ncbi:permease-like cell division protein FtsX [Phytohabitans sp. ZYX-F-186]|uniref:Permease-like cell division protein FtsX n=1 Tax=Phytohabitans maris TaxID=3071409 RepID=A0ABU0ZMK5_9ACTN|nr:permease-like cell division protein FtsX [Phytohabitans sp. ZYX-F-186]MDQ7908268.1 permease-like cell division protein FtsX [Phytohabitans sp. ZYX-F-186]
MDQNLRVLFERALGDEPLPPPGDLAQEAMAGGRRRRRRRHLLAGGVAGVVTVLATVVAVNLATAPPSIPTAMSLAIGPGCSQPVEVVDEIAVFLRHDVTDRQLADLDESLRSDPRVRQVRFQTREAAYEKFKEMYRDAPDLIAAVKPRQIPESFRVTLAQPEQSPPMEEELRRRPGVEAVVRTACEGRPGAGEGE